MSEQARAPILSVKMHVHLWFALQRAAEHEIKRLADAAPSNRRDHKMAVLVSALSAVTAVVCPDEKDAANG